MRPMQFKLPWLPARMRRRPGQSLWPTTTPCGPCPHAEKQSRRTQLRGHSAHISQEVVIYYRWHALHGRGVRQLYTERRSGREVAVVESEPGVAIVVAVWMLDPVACSAMTLGTPAVDLLGLTNLHQLLKSFGLRRACSDALPIEEVHHEIAVASESLEQAAPSDRNAPGSTSVERNDEHRSQHSDPPSSTHSYGGRRRGTRGDRQ